MKLLEAAELTWSLVLDFGCVAPSFKADVTSFFQTTSSFLYVTLDLREAILFVSNMSCTYLPLLQDVNAIDLDPTLF